MDKQRLMSWMNQAMVEQEAEQAAAIGDPTAPLKYQLGTLKLNLEHLLEATQRQAYSDGRASVFNELAKLLEKSPE